MRPAPRARRPASVLAVVSLLAVFVIGMVAFAIDTGYVAGTRTQLQATADAAALAGCQKLGTWPGQAVPEAAARTEVRKFVTLNDPGLTVRDEDVRLLRYNPAAPAGSRVSDTYSIAMPPNAVEVTVRRDDLANGKVPLFFAPILGQKNTDVRARATAYIMPAKAVKPGAPLLPYAMQIDYYLAVTGQARLGVDGLPINTSDTYTVSSTGAVSGGADGALECVLFGPTGSQPGNFGSLDIGSGSNGSTELERQILYGPTVGDFQNSDFRDKVAPDGGLYVPFLATGDTGLSTTTKSAFEKIYGQARIIPLYDFVIGSGDGATYHIVGYAAVTILKVDFSGNPKRLWIQPTRVTTAKATADGNLLTPVTFGIYTPPRLVMP